VSELSSAYSEYERLSNLFRQLNQASLLARRVMFGINPPSPEEQRAVRDQLDEALERLSPAQEMVAASRTPEKVTLTEVLREVPSINRDISLGDVSAIRERIKGGLAALTSEDLETIDTITDALDSASEVLFRRIQR
jgi:Tfp pilus assembly pilus retraction ATPase PilT